MKHDEWWIDEVPKPDLEGLNAKIETYAPRPGDRGEDVVGDRRFRITRASEHMKQVIAYCQNPEGKERIDALANWQLAVLLVVSSLDNVPYKLVAPELGEWRLLRHQMSHVLNVDVKTTTTRFDTHGGTVLHTYVDEESMPYVNPRRGEEKVYVNPEWMNELPTKDTALRFLQFASDIWDALDRWQDRL